VPPINDFDRTAFAEIGQNSFAEYSDEQLQRLSELATELRAISSAAQKRAHDSNGGSV
jgi:hypothetical protein